MERKLSDRISQLEKNYMVMNEKNELNDKNNLIKMVNLENKLETNHEISQQMMNNYQQKLHYMETNAKDNEIRLKETLEKYQQSNLEKLHSMNSEFMNDRLSLERRLIIVEKIAQESLETIKHSQEILNQSILSHPTIQQLSNSLKESLQFLKEFNLLKEELRILSNDFLKLSSQQIPLSDFLFFKEKLMKCDMIVNEKLPEYFESTKKTSGYFSCNKY